VGDTSETRPLFSSFADDPTLGPAIHEFLLGLAERIDALQDAYSRRDFKDLAHLAGGLASQAVAAGFEPLATCASRIETTSLAQKPEPSFRALVELTELVRRARLGHRGAA
jgi:HPt (histidine-containing phosphotransfer) domain-containing protein